MFRTQSESMYPTIIPSQRKRGYATEMLMQASPICSALQSEYLRPFFATPGPFDKLRIR